MRPLERAPEEHDNALVAPSNDPPPLGRQEVAQVLTPPTQLLPDEDRAHVPDPSALDAVHHQEEAPPRDSEPHGSEVAAPNGLSPNGYG